jgi:CTP synthase
MGIQPDILVCRSDYPLDDNIKGKIAQFCNVPKKRVIQNLDVDILYELPLEMEKERLANVVCDCLNMDCPQPDLADWIAMVDAWKNPKHKVQIALVGKYVSLHDAYISVVEALKHGAVANNSEVEIKWVDSELISDYNVKDFLSDVDGIIVPGGFGDRGIEGMICAIRYAREQKIPYLGLCLGMQLTIVEFARNVVGLEDAHSNEFSSKTTNPVIHIMPDKEGIVNLGGTLRLGAYPCILADNSKALQLYGSKTIEERHRHRYEVNNKYREVLQEYGMLLSGFSPDGRIVEMIEIPEHPWFIGTQAHPEFKSRPNKPHPLFKGFLAAALEYQNRK